MPFTADERERKVTFYPQYEINGTLYSFEKEMTFREILTGWGHHPLGSPKGIYDSIITLIEHTGKESTWRDPRREEWHKIRATEPRAIREKVEEH